MPYIHFNVNSWKMAVFQQITNHDKVVYLQKWQHDYVSSGHMWPLFFLLWRSIMTFMKVPTTGHRGWSKSVNGSGNLRYPAHSPVKKAFLGPFATYTWALIGETDFQFSDEKNGPFCKLAQRKNHNNLSCDSIYACKHECNSTCATAYTICECNKTDHFMWRLVLYPKFYDSRS